MHIAAEVKNFDALEQIGDRKVLKLTNRSHRFALAAAEQALRDAGIRPTDADATRWGCTLGAGMMGVEFQDLAGTQAHSAADGVLHPDLLLSDGPANDPLAFCRSNCAEGLSLITRQHGIRGFASAEHTACASGGQALGRALKLIRRGVVDKVLAGGFDSMISPVGIAGFCLLSALSPDNDTPQRASRPFDVSRNGFLLGEGAGFLVLEEWHAARKRGAHIYAELAGDGNSLSSYRITDSPPDGDGPIQAMRQALWSAGAAPADIDYLNAHGTSTGMNDRSESAAIKAVFGADVPRLSVSSTKSTMGHLIAAAGAVEVAIVRAGDSRRHDADQREPARSRSGLRPELRARHAAPSARAHDAVQFLRLRRLQQLHRAAPSGRDRRARGGNPHEHAACRHHRHRRGLLRRQDAARHPGRRARRHGRRSRRSSSGTSRGWPTTMAGEIANFNAREMVDDRKLHKLIRRTDLLGLYAAGKAIDDAGVAAHRDTLTPDAAATFSDRTGVYVGSGSGNFENQYDYFPLLAAANGSLPEFGRELANTVNPMWLLRSLPNNVLGHIGIKYGLKGSNACITSHSCSGSLAVIEGMEALRNGEADRVVAVGHDAPIEPQMVLYYYRLGLIASETLRPFDIARDGSVFGEGAGALVLETEASATARNATVLGEVLGGGYTSEATGLLAIRDDGDGLARAITMALDDAKIAARDVGMIVAHGNGTRPSDASEAAAIRTRVRQRRTAGDGFQVGDRSSDRGRRHPRDDAGSGRAGGRRGARHCHAARTRSGLCRRAGKSPSRRRRAARSR